MEQYYEHEQAVRTTRRLLRSVPVPPLYEAAFTFEGIRTRVDVLHKRGGPGFDLVEVKSSTSVKPEHIPDMAIQLHVLEGSGIPVETAWLMHVNTSYVYQGGPYDLERLFSLEDVTERTRALVAENIPVTWPVCGTPCSKTRSRTSKPEATAKSLTGVHSLGTATGMSRSIRSGSCPD